MNPSVVHPAFASVADFQQAYAAGQAGRSAAANRLSIVAAAGQNLVTPASVSGPLSAETMAVIPFTAKVTGFVMVGFTFAFTDSAADTVSAGVGVLTGVTNVTGGTVTNGIRWRSGAITITGGSLANAVDIQNATFATGNLSQTIHMGGPAICPVGTPAWITLGVSCTHDLSGLILNAWAYEIG